MTTEKQIVANKQNAQLSTGPITVGGKEVVSANAIKHGIFTKDLIITSGPGKENEKEYEELLANLIQCLSPRNQMEYLLVEKIAVDFWRLRRTIRFEAGSIKDSIERLTSYFYSGDTMDKIGEGYVPLGEAADRALKYERSIQKSIFQNLVLLKKLQGIC